MVSRPRDSILINMSKRNTNGKWRVCVCVCVYVVDRDIRYAVSRAYFNYFFGNPQRVGIFFFCHYPTPPKGPPTKRGWVEEFDFLTSKPVKVLLREGTRDHFIGQIRSFEKQSCTNVETN
jgi:hypothetical protein